MKKIYFALILLVSLIAKAQTSEDSIIKNKGFTLGFGIGIGSLATNTNDTLNFNVSTTLPNIKVGYRFSKKIAGYVLLPGANYKYKNKDRGFEGLIIAGQYWLTPKLWMLAGAGFTFDAPAFYTVKDPKTAGFYIGFPAFTFGTGYTLYQAKKFNLDLQYRIFVGESKLPNNGSRQGIANMFILGINW